MKLHRLDLTGFGPFRETQTVDFDAFDDDGVFLISGRTGAGKSSILDGVSFALYGSVPRYDGGDRRLRSDHCFLGDPTEVRLEFTVGERRWRVTRAPEYDRPAKRGGGTTTEPQRAELEEQIDGVWIGRAAKPREVALVLDEILGLNAQQFQQVILLAQNKFSRFLLATAVERQTLLRTLFGTRRFENYKDELDARRREAQKTVDTSAEHARTLLEVAERLITQQGLGGEADIAVTDLPARRDAAEVALQRADYRFEVAARERLEAEVAAAAAQEAWAVATAQAERLSALAAARTELAQREADVPLMAADRERLERARTAEAVRAPIEAAARAVAAHDAAASAQRDAREAWERAGGSGDDDLTAVIDALTSDIALWAAAEAQERDLAEKRDAVDALDRSIADLMAQRVELDAHQAQVPVERERLEGVVAAARTRAERREGLRSQRDAVAAQLGAARAAADLAPLAAEAEAAYLAANTASAAATAHVTLLLQRRLAGIAGELATGLVDGEACAVCGSTSHPHPAPAAADGVTDDDLTAAERARDRAAAAERTAAETARTARDNLADALAAAAGRTADDLEAALAEADAEVRAADEAAEEAAEAERLRSELDELAAVASAARDEVAARLADEEHRRAGLQATVATLEAQLTDARGHHASVADRIAEATRRRDLARALQRAAEQLADRERVRHDAIVDRDERIAAAGIASVEAASAALLDRAECDALEARITEHTQALAAVRARLLDLELDTVDLTSVDLDAARAARDAAEAAHAATIAAETGARDTAARLRELLLRVDDAYAQVSALVEDAAVIARLADSVAGRAPNTMKMDLETFVLAAELEEIVAAANLRLREMSSERYTLHHSDAKASHGRASGLGIEVLDAYTGQRRSPQSLSGGETFLASLALALGLAEVVTNRAGGLRLDTLFVDEGFGSLDPETLDLAMRTLDELRAGGRTVGVISHVETMKEQIAAQLIVEASPEGPSTIRQDAPVAAAG